MVYILKVKKLQRKDILTVCVSMALIIIFLIGVSSIDSNGSLMRTVFGKNVAHVNLYNKTLWNGRNSYFTQAINGIVRKPLLGVGSGNFIYISELFAEKDYERVETSLNILLDFAAENGVISGVLVAICFMLIGINAYRNAQSGDDDTLSFLILYFSLFVLFQFHYYHRVHSLFFLFFLIAGMLYKEKNEITLKVRKWFEYEQ
jgi:O-antigen ligase